MSSLQGAVALVTGGSRGVGKGVAEELSESGATVYVTGRTVDQAELADACVRLRCDHTIDDQVEAVFDRILAAHNRIDILVNNVWGGYERMIENGQFTWARPFWEQPVWRWDSMFAAGVRAHYVASCLAARAMVKQRSGLIVHISQWAAQKHAGNVAYGAAKAATDKLAADMAHELKGTGVCVLSLYPGMVRTEKVMEAAAYLDLSNSESPRFIGRAVAALFSDPHALSKSGSVVVAAECGREYGFTDVDGKSPRPLTLDEI
jgi:NAD(P)-dependent dehydrogenase (short-subunit alcohol dehydrogenase family)